MGENLNASVSALLSFFWTSVYLSFGQTLILKRGTGIFDSSLRLNVGDSKDQIWKLENLKEQREEFVFDNCLLNVIDRHRHSTDAGERNRILKAARRDLLSSELRQKLWPSDTSCLFDDIAYQTKCEKRALGLIYHHHTPCILRR